MRQCYACGRAQCRTPDACALLKPSTFRRMERERREKARAAEREAASVLTQHRTPRASDEERRRAARAWNRSWR